MDDRLTRVWAWVRTHRRPLYGAVAGAVALAVAVWPGFPGGAVLGALSAVLGL